MAQFTSPQLRVGQSGQLGGQRYQVAGWIVMSMDQDGVTYCWNEFHLIAPDGSSATLVQEEGEHGPEWRLFRLLDPAPAITAAEAATKRVGDTVNLIGQTLRITCVDESRVVQIEGQAPEGVEQGDVARYFNAESGNLMVVVSWTGEEVEVFRGVQLPGHAVYRGFGLKPPPVKLQPAGAEYPGKSALARNGLVAMVIGLIGFGVMASRWPGFGRSTAAATPPKVPTPELSIGAAGSIDGARYQVAGRTEVEIQKVGARHARQEYRLVNDAGSEILLVQGTERNGGDWLWLRPVPAGLPLPPRQAATNGLGATVPIGSEAMRVTDLFLTRVRQVEGTTSVSAGTPLYGLEARASGRRAVVRWDETTLTTYRVTSARKEEIRALGGK